MDIECPYCDEDMYVSFGDDAHCPHCNITYETDYEFINDEVGYKFWLTGVEKPNLRDEKTP